MSENQTRKMAATTTAKESAHRDHEVHPKNASISPEPEQFVGELNGAMKKMMSDMHSASYTGNPDVDFLAMMIPHHQGAVDMASLVLLYGNDPLTRRLAEEIIASQAAEIVAMTERLKILRRGEDPDPGGFPALHGTRGPRK